MNLHPLIYTLAISAASLLSAAPAAAQDGYPNKPIKLIVPTTPVAAVISPPASSQTWPRICSASP